VQLEEQARVLGERADAPDAGALIEATRSPAMRHVVTLARQVAVTDTPVLITGETGAGKEVLASAIHGWSGRSAQPMVSINCAALPAPLIESELFGHVKGAFSGAVAARVGRFRAANGGTLFLDEVGELPLELQAKLLRVLEDGSFQPVGSDRTVRVDVRLIAATNADLQHEAVEGRFREDLYYRLAVFPLHVPPLRARREDLPVLVEGILGGIARRTGRGPWHVSEATLRRLAEHSWPGNVRELRNALERATIVSPGPEIDLDAPIRASAPAPPSAAPGSDDERPVVSLAEAERQHVMRALRRSGGKVHGPGGAAELLELNPSTLRSRMKKLGIRASRA
jgi:transcriptional regulator with GAF, ATPase, and Fis domain